MAAITDVSAGLPSVTTIWNTLSFQAGFNSAVVVIGTTLLGISAGIVGTFALLRKRALMSDALAHSALPGLALAYIVHVYLLQAEQRNLAVLLFGASASGVLGVICVQFIVRHTRLSEDSAIGIILSTFFGLGIVLLSVIQNLGTGSAGGLQHFIYGQTAAMRFNDAQFMLIVAFCVAVACVFLKKEFRLVCFDEDFAAVQGWPVSVIDLLMMGLLVFVTVSGLQAVGLILVVSLLVIPPSAARFWTERLERMMYLSAFIGGVSGYLGSVASSLLPRLPAGAVIVLTAGLIFIISFLFAPERGVLANCLRQLRLRFIVAEDHLFRACFEYLESRSANVPAEMHTEMLIPFKYFNFRRGLVPFFIWLVFVKTWLSGLIKLEAGKQALRLTSLGLEEAQRLTRNHRLWEEYVLTFGRLATSHVDYSADLVEHVLGVEMVEKLERALVERGMSLKNLTESVHPLKRESGNDAK